MVAATCRLTSGAVEEVLYRGHAVERLATVTGRLPLGGLLATVAFGAARTPFLGAWSRDLFANAAAHTACC